MAIRTLRLSPAQFLAVSFIGLIAIGTVLLSLPWASTFGRSIGVVDALFTATSAVCVTGLVVVDTASELSVFGQIVILVLLQAGGLGYMAITTVVATALGKRLTIQERLTLQEALNLHTGEGLVRFTLTVFRFTLAFELTGAAILTLWWWPDLGPRAAWHGLFHAVSAFNNAGFALHPDSLIRFRADVVVNLVITTLVICGGLGFLVLTELLRPRRLPLSLHTRLVLWLTGVLLVVAFVSFFVIERTNARTLGPMPIGEAILASWFQAVTPRTAGFNTLDIGQLRQPTLFLMMAMMFIGASPGGTGGGVKTTTFGVTVAALWATVRREDEAVVFWRRLPAPVVARAFFICLISFLALNVTAGLLLVIEERELLSMLFETTSAFGTVGLSMGWAGSPVSLVGFFSPAGKLLIALMMFMGRIGPMTLAVALARGRAKPRIRYPEGKVLIG